MADADSLEPVQFCRTPADLLDDEQPLDFTSKLDMKIYKDAKAPLMAEKFDCCEEDLHDFMQALQKRAHEYGWDERIMMIPITDDDALNPKEASMLTEHVSASIERIRVREELLVNDRTRAGQDMNMLFECLMNSLSKEGRQRINNEKDQYTVRDETGKLQFSGNLLLKVILQKSTVDSAAGSYVIEQKLMQLETLISEVSYDIVAFNAQVKSHIADLERRGTTIPNMVNCLMRGYKSAPVLEFVTFINNIKDRVDFDVELAPVKYNELMTMAENKYRTLKAEGTWTLKSAQEEQIIALEASVARLKKGYKQKLRGSSKDKQPHKRGRSRKKQAVREKLKIEEKPHNIKEPVMFEGNKWWWCSKETGGKCDGKLRKHKPKDCKGSAFLKDKNAKAAKAATIEAQPATVIANIATIAPRAGRSELSEDDSEHPDNMDWDDMSNRGTILSTHIMELRTA